MDNYPFIFACVFLGIGLGITIFGISYIAKGLRIKRWPRAGGTITKSIVNSYFDSEGENMYYPDISYEFEALGKTYIGSMVRYGLGHSSAAESAEQITTNYFTGKNVQVIYNPQDPSSAYLEAKISKWTIAPLLLGLSMSGFSAGMIYSLFYSQWS